MPITMVSARLTSPEIVRWISCLFAVSAAHPAWLGKMRMEERKQNSGECLFTVER